MAISDPSTLDRALFWLDLGAFLIPLQPKSKIIIAGYGPHSLKIGTFDDARFWFERRRAGLGLALSPFAVADFESWDVYHGWRAAWPHVITYAEQSARAPHLFFIGHNLPNLAGPGFEFKAAGVVTLAPSFHPTGARYTVACDAPIVSIDAQQTADYFSFLSRKRPEQDKPTPAPANLLRKEKSKGSLVQLIHAFYTLEDEVNAAGIELRPTSRGEYSARCPFHDDHKPSLWVNFTRGRWGCYSPECPTNLCEKGGDAKARDVINWRAWRNHRGDVAAAVRAMKAGLPPSCK